MLILYVGNNCMQSAVSCDFETNSGDCFVARKNRLSNRLRGIHLNTFMANSFKFNGGIAQRTIHSSHHVLYKTEQTFCVLQRTSAANISLPIWNPTECIVTAYY